MNATQALTRLRKIIGPRAEIQDTRRPSSPEQREAQPAAKRAAKAHKDACEAAMAARRDAILNADHEYQRLKADYVAARVAHEKLPFGQSYRYEADELRELLRVKPTEVPNDGATS